MSTLADVYGDLLVVRAPVPATVNKAGANYKSEVTHLEYPPRRAYYESLLGHVAAAASLRLDLVANPHRWEGMADVAAVGDRVVLTYAVPGHYDADTTPKSSRSTREGVAFAADASNVPEASRIYV